MKILIIEDSQEIIEAIRITLEVRWPEIQLISAMHGAKGIELVETEKPDFVILDIGLPDMSGYDVLKSIRSFTRTPVMILTVRNDEVDIVKGLEWGADDYLVKPFHKMELLARIRALMRRARPVFHEEVISGDMTYNPTIRLLIIRGKEISLTATEGIIINELLKNTGQIVTHSRLAEAIWGEDYPDSTEAIWVYIRRLRKKIETDPENPQVLLTRTGVGYMIKK
jgi:two-component system, OmpR family, response regulator VicR